MASNDTALRERTVWGFGLATVASDGTVLDTWFKSLGMGAHNENSPELAALVSFEGVDERRDVSIRTSAISIDLDTAPSSTQDAYLRLHALSSLLVKPNELNLEGIFGHLPIVAWTNAGPMAPQTAVDRRMELQRDGIQVYALDKFPRLTDYVQPAGVRIADAARVRLGAYLSPGTTVMHEGFVNFNAGTLGAAMVEGRISQGVVIGDGSDIGGGASTMGTLSGGGTEKISIGERTLLGANAGIGISLGDDCVVEAGLYITSNTKVVVADGAPLASGQRPTVKARELSGRNGLLFWRNSVTGAIEVRSREGQGIQLNQTLHA